MRSETIVLSQLPDYLRRLIEAGGIEARTICPKCEGGRTKERSLSIRQVGDEGLILKLSCWRATCGWWATTAHATDRIPTTEPTSRPYTDPIEPLSPGQIDMLVSDYGLSMYDIAKHGWGSGSNGELVMPVLSAYGTALGHTTRTFGQKKFCATYKTAVEQPFLDWWVHDVDTHALVVVEDQLSACRAYSAGYDAVALLGTNISVEDAEQIARRHRAPFLALDRDAFLKSLKLRSRFSHILDFRPVCLDKDIKNMQTDEDIRNLFGVNYDRRGCTGSSNMPAESSV